MKVTLNLFDDLPQDVGFRNVGKFTRIQLGQNDIPKIIECLERKKTFELRKLGAVIKPEEFIRYDAFVYGYLADSMVGKLTGELKDNPEIKSFTYVHPNKEPELIFPLNFE